jgi:serine/threonine protein phosphatase PrpC
MSRSLCDTIGKRAGVSSEPDIYSYTLARGDAFLLLASDGLWEFTSAEEAAEVIVSKNRFGPKGTVKLRFKAESMRFE